MTLTVFIVRCGARMQVVQLACQDNKSNKVAHDMGLFKAMGLSKQARIVRKIKKQWVFHFLFLVARLSRLISPVLSVFICFDHPSSVSHPSCIHHCSFSSAFSLVFFFLSYIEHIVNVGSWLIWRLRASNAYCLLTPWSSQQFSSASITPPQAKNQDDDCRNGVRQKKMR